MMQEPESRTSSLKRMKIGHVERVNYFLSLRLTLVLTIKGLQSRKSLTARNTSMRCSRLSRSRRFTNAHKTPVLPAPSLEQQPS